MAEKVKEVGAIETPEIAVKPLSENSFIAFFQKIWRWWLGVWYAFEGKHPKAAKLIYQFFMFYMISNLVTIYQYLVFLFLPNLLGIGLAGTEWFWPDPIYLGFQVKNTEGQMVDAMWWILGYPVLKNEAGEVIIGGGLGYMIAFAIGTGTAQVINFPMQRNITYRSHGNIPYQIMWYAIGWVLVNLFCNAVNNFLGLWARILPPALRVLIETVVMGTLSIVIFFFIFMIIFPDLQKQKASEEAKLAKMKESGAPADKIAKFEEKFARTVKMAEVNAAEKALYTAESTYNAKAMAWDAVCKQLEKAKDKGASEEEIKAIEARIAEKHAAAVEAYKARAQVKADFDAVLAKYGISSAKEAFAK